jgi:hypothetical protein
MKNSSPKNYYDSHIVSILKYTHEPIQEGYEDQFVAYNLQKRYKEVTSIKVAYSYLNKDSLYAIFTLLEPSQKDLSSDSIQPYPLRALEFKKIYQTQKAHTNDLFIYEIDKNYFFALYLKGELAYIKRIFIKSNFLRLYLEAKEFIENSLKLSVDQTYFVNIPSEEIANSKDSIEWIQIPETYDMPIYLKGLRAKKNNFKLFVVYNVILFLLFVGFVFDASFEKEQMSRYNAIPKYSIEKTTPLEKNEDTVSLLTTFTYVTEQLRSCDMKIAKISLSHEVKVEASYTKKSQLLSCIEQTNLELIESSLNEDGKYHASFKINL